ncbi:hypothetical protein [uncultured Campylobacter sp.]
MGFDPETESKSDDIMDAAAYILQYIAGRFFDESYDEIYDDYVEEESWA